MLDSIFRSYNLQTLLDLNFYFVCLHLIDYLFRHVNVQKQRQVPPITIAHQSNFIKDIVVQGGFAYWLVLMLQNYFAVNA